MDISWPRTARFTSAIPIWLIGAIVVLGATRATAGDIPPAVVSGASEDLACGSPESAASEAVAFTDGLAQTGSEQIEADVGGDFEWFSLDAPPALVPRVQNDPHFEMRQRNFGHFVAFGPSKLVRFKKRMGGLPVKLGAVAIARVGAKAGGQRYADFAYSGRVLGRAAWRRELQMVGKGAINCDGTLRVWSMGIVGGSTPWPRQSGVCNERRIVARVDGTKVCRQW